jgi:hypothetical protein
VILDLDLTIRELLETRAAPGSELAGADVVFDLPDAVWRSGLGQLTVNCYLYDVRENPELRTIEPLMHRSGDGARAARLRPPSRIDCSYCITAWSTATDDPVLEEHRVLGQVLRILLRNPTMPTDVLQGSLAVDIPPYPTIIAAADGIRNQPDFWGALDQQLKPSLNYVITLAMMLDDEPADPEMTPVITEVEVTERHMAELP